VESKIESHVKRIDNAGFNPIFLNSSAFGKPEERERESHNMLRVTLYFCKRPGASNFRAFRAKNHIRAAVYHKSPEFVTQPG
jgi:hypothetical protein